MFSFQSSFFELHWIVFQVLTVKTTIMLKEMTSDLKFENRPNRLTQCCTQFKYFSLSLIFTYHIHVNASLMRKYNKQIILFPVDLNRPFYRYSSQLSAFWQGYFLKCFYALTFQISLQLPGNSIDF